MSNYPTDGFPDLTAEEAEILASAALEKGYEMYFEQCAQCCDDVYIRFTIVGLEAVEARAFVAHAPSLYGPLFSDSPPSP